MKLLSTFILSFIVLGSFAQQDEFYLQGQVVDFNNHPVSDAHVFNPGNSSRSVSTGNGIFDVRVHPGDSIIITHISFIRKVVTVHQLLVNPVVKLETDTINIRPVNVSASQRTDYERAMTNIKRIEFDFRPNPDDNFTETERLMTLMQTENQVQRVAASSVSLVSFSPSEEISKIISKRKKKKDARQFSSTKQIDEKQ